MEMLLLALPVAVIALAVGGVVGYAVRRRSAAERIASAEEQARMIVEEARKEAERKQKELLVEAREEAHRLRQDLERETRERRAELQRLERRLQQKEEQIDRKIESLEKKEDVLSQKERDLDNTHRQIQELKQAQVTELERISQMTTEDARREFLAKIEQEARSDAAKLIREVEAEAKAEADQKAREIVTLAVQRVAADHIGEVTASVVQLPNDEMKGRIIGREGRNIRTLETLTGVDLIIDDTPEAVVLSGFDPVRREVAKLALQKLIADGRIHPARIEEMVEKAQREIEQKMRDEGEAAVFESGVHGLHPELVKILGRLKYRYSYGQNVLKHSLEVSHLSGIMAAELGCDVKVAKRAGLVHDIGKALDHEWDGTHIEIGRALLRKYKEHEDVIHAMETHHGDVEPRTLESVIVTAADALSAARPGARRETLESYIKRLEKLEKIADSFEGVEKSYAIQAGREVRIMVKPERIDDYGCIKLSKEITKKIEEELEFPGQIKVTVIRETRAVEYAR